MIVGVSSQCVTILTGASLNMASRVSWLSTNMSPVEAPMKTLRPQARVLSNCFISSMFVLLAPI